MHISLSEKKLVALKRMLESSPDAQAMADGEYILDLFEREPPLSLELILQSDGVDVTAAAVLAFDEELDGWYLNGRIEDAATLAGVLEEIE